MKKYKKFVQKQENISSNIEWYILIRDGSYFVSDIQDDFGLIIKKYETATDNPPIRKYVNKIKDRITLNIKTGYYLELLITETKLQWRSDKMTTKSGFPLVEFSSEFFCTKTFLIFTTEKVRGFKEACDIYFEWDKTSRWKVFYQVVISSNCSVLTKDVFVLLKTLKICPWIQSK